MRSPLPCMHDHPAVTPTIRPLNTSPHPSCISKQRSGRIAGESDPGAQQVLAHHFPGKLLLPDVKAIQCLPEVCSPLKVHSISTTITTTTITTTASS